jgi:hypothetical protein
VLGVVRASHHHPTLLRVKKTHNNMSVSPLMSDDARFNLMLNECCTMEREALEWIDIGIVIALIVSYAAMAVAICVHGEVTGYSYAPEAVAVWFVLVAMPLGALHKCIRKYYQY